MALKPKNWPLHLTYISAPKYSPQLSKDQAKALTVCPDSLIKVPDEICRLPSTQAKIVPISDAKHPANGQAGLFATKNLKPGAPILLYLGIVHPPDTAHETSDYDLWLDHDLEIAVDAATTGNEARFINDYRGVKQRPNAEFREVWSVRHRQRCMAVFVLDEGKSHSRAAGISKGEEILVSYGKGFWQKRQEEQN
ncbi:hypothetical protein CFIMG_002356RA [Ceratocystis fimbriata CBS 114723]|uniref:SET domain-containing protein n=1 Tax=Ceratocystis fimbriata CBS 114723 TaxID=1035309 RepID=A0A2C5WU17_9PEZI|nr:hypothetical protein CFIMG_002356RA [Ceratocystis fimbriata CBS 114723]